MTQMTLIKTLQGNNGEIFILKGGRRMLLSSCSLEIRIYEDATEIPTLGRNAQVKTYHAALTVCEDINDKVDVSDLDTGYFEIQTDIETRYNQIERVLLDKLAAVELINLDEWTFDIIDMKMIKRLLEM